MKSQEIFDWIAKIIATCNNDFHFDAIDVIETFGDENMKTDLKLAKWNEIHLILS
jgi:hypothetical protein